MTKVLILTCYRCGGLLLAQISQKTRTCPYCGARIDTDRAHLVASAAGAFEASEMLKKLKSASQQ